MKNTILTNDISSSAGKATYDTHCLKLLSNAAILSRIVGALAEEFENIPPEEIAGKYLDTPQIREVPVFPDDVDANHRINGISNQDKSNNEGERDYDILFHATAPAGEKSIRLIMNLEAQNKQR